MNSKKTPWVLCTRPNPDAKLRLFCFPYAGGGTAVYRSWSQKFPEEVEIYAICPPGREMRIREQPFTRMQPLVASAAEAIRPYLDRPFVFFGHSLGALVSYELTQQLRRENIQPQHLFVSGHRAPHRPLLNSAVHLAPLKTFLTRLRLLNGTPEEFFRNPELVRMMMPCLRADFAVWETYAHGEYDALDIPISAFWGEDDSEARLDDMVAWEDHTQDQFSLHTFTGGHFYLHDDEDALIRLINQKIQLMLQTPIPLAVTR